MVIVYVNVGCKKEEQISLRNEYFTCYLNGNYWEANGGPYCRDITTYYYENGFEEILKPGYLAISGTDCSTNSTLGFALNYDLNQRTFNLQSDTSVVSCVFIDRTNFVSTIYDSVLHGQLIITAFIPRKEEPAQEPDGTPSTSVIPGWVEGVFDGLILTNEARDSLIINDGRFAAQI